MYRRDNDLLRLSLCLMNARKTHYWLSVASDRVDRNFRNHIPGFSGRVELSQEYSHFTKHRSSYATCFFPWRKNEEDHAEYCTPVIRREAFAY
jgi:hypothetical protein